MGGSLNSSTHYVIMTAILLHQIGLGFQKAKFYCRQILVSSTLPQKKRKLFEVAFLLGKSVHHLILYQTTLDQGRNPSGTVKNWHIKVAFLLGNMGKNVVSIKLAKKA